MTIALGLKCSDGIVLGCDSQMTAGVSKWKEKKICHFPQLKLKSDPYFAYATDDAGYAKNAINRLAGALKRAEKGHSSLLASLHGEIKQIHREYSRILPKKEERPVANFLLALRKPALTLYLICGIEITEVDKAEYIGTGDSIARSTIDPVFLPSITTHDAARLAVYALLMAKEYATFIDKPFHVVRLVDSSSSDLIPSPFFQWLREKEVTEMEEDFRTFLQAIGPVLRTCYLDIFANPDFDAFGEELRKFSNAMKKHRQKYVRRAKGLQRKLDEYENELEKGGIP